MPWELDIVHIDVISSGDATLFVARERNAMGVLQQTRSILIDGGYGQYVRDIEHVVTIDQGLASIDALVTTHYDRDHWNGTYAALVAQNYVDGNTRVYDSGIPANVRAKRTRSAPGYKVSENSMLGGYRRYRQAIQNAGCDHVTGTMLSYHNRGPFLPVAVYHEPDWLLGHELFWQGHDPANAIPAGAPTMTVVAVNQYVTQAGGGPHYLPATALASDESRKNQRSIAVLLEFGGFKYYLGGDLENKQENDGGHGLKLLLNQTNNNTGRVHGLKTSHHGANTASATGFINRLRPRAAFISCGTENQYGHPDGPVIARLEAKAGLTHYYLTGEENGRALTAKAVICGERDFQPHQINIVQSGDIRLNITEAQAGANPVNFSVLYNGVDVHGAPQVMTDNY